jgi:metallo-beta-lactamase family protein
MEVKLFGAAREVTGSCYSIDAGDSRILVDCGMFQGGKENERLNHEDFPFNPQKYNAMILTHAHLDHCGRVPKLVKLGFKGKIFATNATRELAEIIMRDSARIGAEDTEHENRRRAQEGLPPRKPVYNEIDVKNTMKLFVEVDYGEEFKVAKNISAKLYDAGHILGASSVQLKIKEADKIKTIVFSGDLGQEHSIIVKDIQPIKEADYVFIESTYGDRLHPPLDERRKELIRIINDSYKRKGKLMIPSFAVERAQELLYYIGDFMQRGLIPKMKVFLDSPMAQRATEVFSRYHEYYNKDMNEALKKRKDIFNFPQLIKTEKTSQSKEINDIKEPCIIIAGNGMCTGGRIKHHIKHGIGDAKNTLLFVGFQVKGTLGYWIKKGEKKIRLLGTESFVKAKIEAIDGFSAHADSEGLDKWIKNFKPKPKKIFITHGDLEQAQAFSAKLEKENYKTYIPSLKESLKL